MRTLLATIVQLYVVCLFARLVLSWFPLRQGGVFATVYEFLFTITEPVLAPIRRVVPMLRIGGMGLDLSPIIVIFAAQILLGILG